MRHGERDRLEVEALLTDRYLESLFAALDRHGLSAPADADLTPDVRAAADVLAANLARVHPSFRFEERLAAQLQDLAAVLRAGHAPAIAHVIPLPDPRVRSRRARRDRGRFGGFAAPRLTPPRLSAPHFGAPRLAPPRVALPSVDATLHRPLLIGGALTSAALSVAGAYVAWRRGHGADPWTRAVRATRAGRAAAQAGRRH